MNNKTSTKNINTINTASNPNGRNKPKKANPNVLKQQRATVKVNSKPVNSLYWGVTLIFVIGVSVFNTVFAEDYNRIVRLIIAVVGIIIALGAFVLTNQGRAFVKFGLESLLELKKIYWPTRREALITALIVIAISVLVSFMFWLFDSIIQFVVSIITHINF